MHMNWKMLLEITILEVKVIHIGGYFREWWFNSNS